MQFRDGSSVTGRAKNMLQNFTYVGRKKFTFCTCGCAQSQKNCSFPLPKEQPQPSAKFHDPSFPFLWTS